MTHTSGLSYGSLFRRPQGDPILVTDDFHLRHLAPTAANFAATPLAFEPGALPQRTRR